MAISFSIYFFVNRNEKVIKKTSPFFSQLMLLGILLCITSQIFWDVSQSKFTCLVKIWLLAIGFGLIMGNLLAKTYRIFKIFSNAKVTSLVIRDTDLLIFTGSIIVLEIILLSCYSFPSGLPRPVVIQSTSDSLLKIIKCQVPSSFLQTGGTIWLLGVNFLLVLAAVIIAYLTRNVDSAFNESRYIAYTVYVFLLVTIILLPLYYTAGDSSSSNSRQFIIRTLAILVSMFFCLGALFLPKIYLVHKAKKAERKAAEAGAEREQERRLVDVGTTTVGVTGLPTSGYTEGSMGGGGAYSRVLRGSSTTGGTGTTSSGSGEETVIMPGGPRVSSSTADQSSSAAGATTPSTTGGPGNEYSSLISSLAKRSNLNKQHSLDAWVHMMTKRGLFSAIFILGMLTVLSYGAIQSTCKENGHVALTFDFGPGPFTGKLLDILFAKKIPVTFHVTADLFRNLTLVEYVRRAHSEGHTIGIFIPESPQYATLEAYPEEDSGFTASVIQQITIASNWITSITGGQPKYIRFGSKKTLPIQMRRSIEQQLGLTVTKPRTEIRDENNKMDSIWNSLSKGFAQATPDSNSFILRQRDTMSNSVAHVEKIIDFITEKGYHIVPMALCVPPRELK